MKTIFKFCAAAVLVISTANSAFAADTADLKVQGTLIMGSCTPTLSSGGVVDFGKISVGSLNTADVNQLGTKEITLTLTCKSPTKVAWVATDDRSDSVVDTKPVTGTEAAPFTTDEFGLGKTVGGVKLGSYALLAANKEEPVVDGAQGHVGFSDDDAATWTAGSGAGTYSHGDGSRLITFVDTTGIPVAFTTASDILRVGASIQDSTTLAITDDTPLDGQATISVKYL
ncbi:hypothetical protein C3Z09_15775 [Lelliottia aquatilis]|uniref:DUF1120 domain-containing protein n=1 Tax=Lelliottia aquatilis TaxID=2080838 RepID=UPI000CDF2CEA|nr:DUF1120 domain-containing protein [Lelliottia aquatilis]POZ15139.1 hypothetical protein C3Z09_15775 [Lelliottia aquatilis]